MGLHSLLQRIQTDFRQLKKSILGLGTGVEDEVLVSLFLGETSRFPIAIYLFRTSMAIALLLVIVRMHIQSSGVGSLYKLAAVAASISYLGYAIWRWYATKYPRGLLLELFCDTVFAGVSYYIFRGIESSAFLFFCCPTFLAGRQLRGRALKITLALIVITYLAISGVMLYERGYFAETTGLKAVFTAVIILIMFFFVRIPVIIGAGVVGLAIPSYMRKLREDWNRLEKSNNDWNKAFQSKQAVLDGINSGISILNLDGSIQQWNEKQGTQYARAGAKEEIAKKMPCYWVYHEQKKPCYWCALKWDPMEKANQQAFGKYRIDTEDLQRKIDLEKNWCISNQLNTGEKGNNDLRLFHIYFGLLKLKNKPIGVVESVSDITETVLEMPFLRKDQHDRTSGLPLPPISVLDMERKVVNFNTAKQHRSPKTAIGELCYKAFKGPSADGFCKECPVKRVIDAPTPGIEDGMTYYPGPAMVTCVPLLGPDEKPRAIFEFISDVSELEEAKWRAKLLADQREEFIEIIQYTHDIFDAEKAVSRAIEKSQRLLNKLGEKTAVSVYTVQEPWQGVLPSIEITDNVGIRLRFGGGAGADEFKEKPDKWRVGKYIFPAASTLRLFQKNKSMMFVVSNAQSRESLLLLESTVSVFMIPFCYRGRVLGYIVAESANPDPKVAFSKDTRRLLKLFSGFLGLLMGRFRLLAECIGSGHGWFFMRKFGDSLEIQRENLTKFLDQKTCEEIFDRLKDCNEELAMMSQTYRILSRQDEEMKCDTVNVRTLVETAIKRFERMLPNGSRSPVDPLNTYLGESYVRCNETAMRSILSELLYNAWKYRDPGTNLRVSVTQTEQLVEVSVTNTRARYGIPLEIADRIFEIAYRWTNADNSGAYIEGTGLGLWQAWLLMEAQKAKISLKNPGPPNITFALSLPRVCFELPR